MSWVTWHIRSRAGMPESSDWLGPWERAFEASLRLEPRRQAFLSGRFAAKELLEALPMAEVDIRQAEDGAPELYYHDRALPFTLSISHRDELAASVLGPGELALGCDLERVEPRSPEFVTDYFTEREQAEIEAAGADRHLFANLMWSFKESALKALRCGLRRDTRSVEICAWAAADDSAAPNTVEIRNREAGPQRLYGEWIRHGDHVFTVVADQQISLLHRAQPLASCQARRSCPP